MQRRLIDGLTQSCSPRALHGQKVGLCSPSARQPSHIVHERAVVVRPRFCSRRLRLGRGPVRLRVASCSTDLLADLAPELRRGRLASAAAAAPCHSYALPDRCGTSAPSPLDNVAQFYTSAAAVVLRQPNRHRCGQNELVIAASRRRLTMCSAGEAGRSLTQRCVPQIADALRLDGTNANGSSLSREPQRCRCAPSTAQQIVGASQEPGFAALKSSAAAAGGSFRNPSGRSEVTTHLIHPLAQHRDTLAPLQTAHSAHC